MTPERKEEIRATEAAATPGMWYWTRPPGSQNQKVLRLESDEEQIILEGVGIVADNDAAFIASARSIVSELLAYIEELEIDLADTESELEAVTTAGNKWLAQFIPAEMYDEHDHDEHGEALQRWRKLWDKREAVIGRIEEWASYNPGMDPEIDDLDCESPEYACARKDVRALLTPEPATGEGGEG